ncbi:MAG: hypothetical protein QHC90_13405 [Shinella sp.]|nr:hypothetical protein [Shinella sp.]
MITDEQITAYAKQEADSYVQWLHAGNSTGELSEHARDALQHHFSHVVRHALTLPSAGEAEPVIARWASNDGRLPEGAEVVILASDPSDPNVPARQACWVRHWPPRAGYPEYRSCDLCDLEEVNEGDFERLFRPSPSASEAQVHVRGDIAAVREALTDPTIASYPDFVAAVTTILDELDGLRALSTPEQGETAPSPKTQVRGYLHRLKGGGEWNISLPSQMERALAYQSLWPDKIEIVPLVAQAALTSGGRQNERSIDLEALHGRSPNEIHSNG